jgi:transcriptional regulator with XRE-family HTH domain
MVRVKILKLKRIIKESGMNQSHFANAIGIDPGLISKVLNGRVIYVGNKFFSSILRYSRLNFDDLFYFSPGYYFTKKYIDKNVVSIPSDLPADEVSNPRKGKSHRLNQNHPS